RRSSGRVRWWRLSEGIGRPFRRGVLSTRQAGKGFRPERAGMGRKRGDRGAAPAPPPPTSRPQTGWQARGVVEARLVLTRLISSLVWDRGDFAVHIGKNCEPPFMVNLRRLWVPDRQQLGAATESLVGVYDG